MMKDQDQQIQIFKICRKCCVKKHINEFHMANTTRGYIKSECKECDKLRKNKWREYKRSDNRKRIIHYLGGAYVCRRCGFTHNTSSPFDWHHVDGETKLKNPMHMIHDKWDKLKEELDKCEFLCSNCHRIHHHG